MMLVKQIFKYESPVYGLPFVLKNDFRTYIYGRKVGDTIHWEEDISEYKPCSDIEEADPKELACIMMRSDLLESNKAVKCGDGTYLGSETFPAIRDSAGGYWIYKDGEFFLVTGSEWQQARSETEKQGA